MLGKFFSHRHQKQQALKRCKNGEFPDYVKNYLLHFEQENYKLSITDCRFVVFDTETTGLNPAKDKVISIGAIGLEDLSIHIHDSLEVFIQGDTVGTKESVPVHQILCKDLENGHTQEEALQCFLKFIGNNILVAHYAEFDIRMMSKMMMDHFGIPLFNRSLDTIKLAKRLELGLMSHQHNFHKPQEYTLDRLCERYKIPISARHNAAGDALATAKLLQTLLHQCLKRGITTVKDVLA